MKTIELKTPMDVETRLAILQCWWARRKMCRRFGFEAALARFLAERRERGVKLSRSTLYGWDRAYLRGGLKGLADFRSGRKGREATPFLNAVTKVYFGRPSLAMALRLVKAEAAEHSWKVESYSVCKRYVARRRIERTSTERNSRA